jgi:hypothetical protein
MKRIRVPPALNQFNQALDKNTGLLLFCFLLFSFSFFFFLFIFFESFTFSLSHIIHHH